MEEAVEGEEHCCGSEDRKRRTGGAGGAEEGRREDVCSACRKRAEEVGAEVGPLWLS